MVSFQPTLLSPTFRLPTKRLQSAPKSGAAVVASGHTAELNPFVAAPPSGKWSSGRAVFELLGAIVVLAPWGWPPS